MKNVLITGGCGYIGSHIAVELLAKDYGVVIYDNLINSSTIALDLSLIHISEPTRQVR